MPIARDRPPNIKDGLILVAATAVGLAAARSIHGRYLRYYSDRWFAYPHWLAPALLGSASLILAAWTPALLVVRLVGPRPRLRRLAREPGCAATLGASVALAAVGSFVIVLNPVARFPSPPVV